MASHETHRAIDAVWRIESAKVIAKVARMVQEAVSYTHLTLPTIYSV